jgi:murein endopeptidase
VYPNEYSAMSLSVGSPTAGWQLRAKPLRPGPELRIQEKSPEHSYGLPSLVLMLNRTAKQIARETPGSRLLVGDLSHQRQRAQVRRLPQLVAAAAVDEG